MSDPYGPPAQPYGQPPQELVVPWRSQRALEAANEQMQVTPVHIEMSDLAAALENGDPAPMDATQLVAAVLEATGPIIASIAWNQAAGLLHGVPGLPPDQIPAWLAGLNPYVDFHDRQAHT